ASPRRRRVEASQDAAPAEQSESGTFATPASARTERKAWDDRHHVVFSNHNLQKNVRSYFDRPREVDSFGERHDPPMRTSWRLESSTSEGASAKNPTISTALPPSSLARSVSTPDMVTIVNIERGSEFRDSQRKWNPRHHVVFNKDNPKLPPAQRDYFERPRPIMW
ncbi:unnamed protein product, partial [Prorocentrum cordatum]